MAAPASGILFYEGRAKPLSTTGAIQPGAYYQFYLSGTSTLANVYADGGLTTPLSQTPGTGGTTAASDGRLVPIYLNPAIVYRYQLYSSTGVLLEDIDPFVTGAASSASLIPSTDDAFSIGAPSFRWQNLYLSKQALIGIPTTGPAILGLQDNTRSFYLRTGGAGAGVFDIYDNTSSASRVQVSTAGNVVVNNPSSGIPLSVGGAGVSGASPILSVMGDYLSVNDGTHETLLGGFTSGGFVGTFTSHEFDIRTANTARLTISNSGNVVINAPSSGYPLTLNTSLGGNLLSISDGTLNANMSLFGETMQFGTLTNHNLSIYTNNSTRVVINNAGNVTINPPSSGDTLTLVGAARLINARGMTADGDGLIVGRTGGTNNPYLRVNFAESTNITLLDANGTTSSGFLALSANSNVFLTGNAVGNVIIPAVASGITLTLGDSATSTPPSLNLGTAIGRGAVIRFLGASAAQGKNWLIGNQFNASDTFEITPSTVAGGSTFNVPALKITGSGNVTINAPSSAAALSVSSAAGSVAINLTSAAATQTGLQLGQVGQPYWQLYQPISSGDIRLYGSTNAKDVLSITQAGNVTISAPSSSNALTVTGTAGSNTIAILSSSVVGSAFGLLCNAGSNSSDYNFLARDKSGVTYYFQIRGDGLVQAIDDGGTLQTIGWRGTPLNSQAAGYTLALADRGKSVSMNSGTTVTVPANIFSGGDVVTILAVSGGAVTVAQGASLTLTWANGGATTGSRTLTSNGVATVVFISATSAIITGSGLS